MKKILLIVITLGLLVFANETQTKKDTKQEVRAKKQIQIEMEREKKYAKEQTFYKGDDYDLKGAEVNKESVLTTPVIEVEDLDMDSVYD
jgi:hypothetical protein